MEPSDKVFLALISTLFLAVLIIEGRNRWASVRPIHRKSLEPPKGNERLLERSNVPLHRPDDSIVTDVAIPDQP